MQSMSALNAYGAKPGGNVVPGTGRRSSVESQTSIPRAFQVAVLLFILLTGVFPQILQALINGLVASKASFTLALLLGLVYDLLRVAPLIVLARHPAGILHPLIVAVVVWPLLSILPTLIDTYGGYAGLLSGNPLRAPYFMAIGWFTPDRMWTEVITYTIFQIIGLLSLYAGFAFARNTTAAPLNIFANVDTKRLRAILIGIVIANMIGVILFIELRGGLVVHVMELSYGRFRALAGLGPLLALFDIGFLAMLLWVCTRPQDARSLAFIGLLILVAAQQFLVAGSRAATVLTFVLVGLGWAMAAKRVPWKLGLVLLPVAFLSFGALNIIRTAGLSNTTAIDAAQNADLESILASSQEDFELRQAFAGTIPVTSDAMRTTGPMWGYTYAGAVFAVVPRALWTDKPRGPGSLYAQYFMGEAVEGTAIPIGPVAEAYWNFHIPGIIAIFTFYGVILKFAYNVYARNPQNGMVIAGFVLTATQFGVSTDQLVAFQQMLIASAILLGIIFLFYRGAFSGQAREHDLALPRPALR